MGEFASEGDLGSVNQFTGSSARFIVLLALLLLSLFFIADSMAKAGERSSGRKGEGSRNTNDERIVRGRVRRVRGRRGRRVRRRRRRRRGRRVRDIGIKAKMRAYVGHENGNASKER